MLVSKNRNARRGQVRRVGNGHLMQEEFSHTRYLDKIKRLKEPTLELEYDRNSWSIYLYFKHLVISLLRFFWLYILRYSKNRHQGNVLQSSVAKIRRYFTQE